MSYNYTLQYRTFDALLADVYADFSKYHTADLIEPHQLVKIARRVNYDLGLRIFQTKEKILEVERGKVRLPNDFFTLNFAFICGKYTVKTPIVQGTQVEERIVEPVRYQQVNWTPDLCPAPVVQPDPCNTCGDPCANPCTTCTTCNTCCTCVGTVVQDSCQLNCKGDSWYLVEHTSFQTREYQFMEPLKILDNGNSQDIDCDCPNVGWNVSNTAWIKDGWLYTNFKTGKVYLNYQGMLEDEDCNLLVPDHPLLNEYYEYAIKQRVLENLIMDDQPVSQGKIGIIEQRYRTARNHALSLVNTPNFSELQKVWQANRKSQYAKYYDMFKSYDPIRMQGFRSGLSQNRYNG